MKGFISPHPQSLVVAWSSAFKERGKSAGTILKERIPFLFLGISSLEVETQETGAIVWHISFALPAKTTQSWTMCHAIIGEMEGPYSEYRPKITSLFGLSPLLIARENCGMCGSCTARMGVVNGA